MTIRLLYRRLEERETDFGRLLDRAAERNVELCGHAQAERGLELHSSSGVRVGVD